MLRTIRDMVMTLMKLTKTAWFRQISFISLGSYLNEKIATWRLSDRLDNRSGHLDVYTGTRRSSDGVSVRGAEGKFHRSGSWPLPGQHTPITIGYGWRTCYKTRPDDTRPIIWHSICRKATDRHSGFELSQGVDISATAIQSVRQINIILLTLF